MVSDFHRVKRDYVFSEEAQLKIIEVFIHGKEYFEEFCIDK